VPYRKYHSTRHTYATWMLETGADLRWVQEQMGHASVQQTADTYGHLLPDRHRAASGGTGPFPRATALRSEATPIARPNATPAQPGRPNDGNYADLEVVEGKGFEPSTSGVRFLKSCLETPRHVKSGTPPLCYFSTALCYSCR
jgi:Phage integrase family